MKVSNYASNSNNFKLRIFLKSQSKGESSSQYPILNSQKFVFGDDEKNHKTPKPLILYEDRDKSIYSAVPQIGISPPRIHQPLHIQGNQPKGLHSQLIQKQMQKTQSHFTKFLMVIMTNIQIYILTKIDSILKKNLQKKFKGYILNKLNQKKSNKNHQKNSKLTPKIKMQKNSLVQNKNQQTSAKKITGKFNYSELIQQYIYQLFINLNLIQYFGLKEFIRISLRILFFQKFFLKKLKDLQRELNQESNLQESLGELKQEGHHEDFGDIFVHQVIETIEFVLGPISNTVPI